MTSTIHALDYLNSSAETHYVQVVFGDEPFLKRLVLKHMRKLACPDDDAPPAVLDGTSAQWRDVHDELYTVSLFNPTGQRVVIVEDGDKFVQENRERLDGYLQQSQHHGVLILEVSKWAANTRLYKLVNKTGLQVECRLPQVARGRQKVVDQKQLLQWLVDWGAKQHQVKLAKNAATLLLDLIGPEFGLLDQELAKLALYAGEGGKISEKLVREKAGGWRARTAWELIDAALFGDATEALSHLNRLLQTGEHPNALFGPISWSLRRFAAAIRVYQRAARRCERIKLTTALEQGGFYRSQHETAEKQIKQLGQQRAAQLNQWLLETDLALKGSHSSPDMARLKLEQLILRLDKHLAFRRTTAS